MLYDRSGQSGLIQLLIYLADTVLSSQNLAPCQKFCGCISNKMLLLNEGLVLPQQ